MSGNNPEIKIGADLSGVDKEVVDLGAKIDDAAKPREVVLDTTGAEKAIDKLGEAGKQVDKQLSLPAAVTAQKKLNDELAKTVKMQGQLASIGVKRTREQVANARTEYDAWRQSGARGTRRLPGTLDEYLDGGWRKAALSETEAKRMRAQVLGAIGLGDGRPGSPGGGAPGSAAGFAARALAMTGRGVAGQLLPSPGLGGRIFGQGIAEASGAGGFTSAAGLGRLALGGVIGAAAFGAMKLVGAVAGKVGAAQEEGQSRSDLIRSVGGTADEFDRLRESASALGRGLDVTTGEATGLSRAYAAASGIGQSDRGRLFDETGRAGGFARLMGLDVGSTVSQFAELRRTGQDSPDKLGRSIADAISKRGDFGRLSEVLGNLTAYSSQVAGGSLTRANTDNVLDVAARLAQLRLPGLGTAEGIGRMAAMDAGFRGGAGGESGDMLLLSSMMRRGMPATGYDVQSVREAGLMANVRDVFGENSPAYRAAAARGDTREMDRLGRMSSAAGNGTVFDSVYGGLQARYGGNTQQLASALQAMGAPSRGDAYALMAAMRGRGTAGVLEQLKGLGVDTTGINVGQMAQAAGVLSAGHADLVQRRADMLARTGADALTDQQRSAIAAAGDDDEKLRKVLAPIAAKETIKTEGEKTRDSLAAIDNAVTTLASKLIPIMEGVREAVVRTAQFFKVIDQDKADELMGVSPVVKLQRQSADLSKQIESAKVGRRVDVGGKPMFLPPDAGVVEGLTKQKAAIDAQIGVEQRAEFVRDHPDSPEAAAQRARDEKVDRSNADLTNSPSALDPLFRAASIGKPFSWRELKLLATRESTLNPNAKHDNANGTTDYGLMGINGSNLDALGLTPETAMNPVDNIRAGAAIYAEMLKRAGGDRRAAARMYNGGPYTRSAAADAYGDAFAREVPMLAPDTLPDAKVAPGAGAAPAAAGPALPSYHELTVTVKDSKGNQLAPSKTIPLAGSGTPKAAGLYQIDADGGIVR
jgi:hypothetical protein